MPLAHVESIITLMSKNSDVITFKNLNETPLQPHHTLFLASISVSPPHPVLHYPPVGPVQAGTPQTVQEAVASQAFPGAERHRIVPAVERHRIVPVVGGYLVLPVEERTLVEELGILAYPALVEGTHQVVVGHQVLLGLRQRSLWVG